MANVTTNKGSKPAPAASKPAPTPAKVEKVKVTAIPDIRDKDGILLELSKADFPKGREGRLAFFDYQIAKLEQKKALLSSKGDPKVKAQAKMAKLKAQLKKLQALIDGTEDEEEEEGE